MSLKYEPASEPQTVGVKGKTLMAVGMERRELQPLEVHDSNCKLWQVFACRSPGKKMGLYDLIKSHIRLHLI